MRRAIEFLVGSLAVYGAMAACSAGGSGSSATQRAPSISAAGTGQVVPDASAAEPASGSRLRAIVFVAEDGSREGGHGWHDKQRDEDCYFQKMEDGKLHCVPSAAALTYFGSADCASVPLTVLPTAADGCVSPYEPSVSAPKNMYASDACALTRTRFDVSPSRFTADAYAKSGASCIKTNLATLDVRELVNPQPMPAALFVSGQQSLE